MEPLRVRRIHTALPKKDKELKEGQSYFDYFMSNNDKKTSFYPDSYLEEGFSSKEGDNMIISFILLEQAKLFDGQELSDTKDFITRLNRVISKAI